MNCCPMFGLSSEPLETIRKRTKKGSKSLLFVIYWGVLNRFFIQKIGLNSGRTKGKAGKKPRRIHFLKNKKGG